MREVTLNVMLDALYSPALAYVVLVSVLRADVKLALLQALCMLCVQRTLGRPHCSASHLTAGGEVPSAAGVSSAPALGLYVRAELTSDPSSDPLALLNTEGDSRVLPVLFSASCWE
jgi:hypothetical protein